jgi:hypothetical protein
MRTKSFLAALVMSALIVPAFAQGPGGGGGPPPASNVRGKIVKVDGRNVTVKTREGQTVNVALTADAGVRYMKKSKLSDVKQGDYISILSMPGKDGKQHAVDIHGIPARAPENQIPFDYAPNSMMTNAHVQGVVKAKNGNTLTVTQRGQTSEFIIDGKTMIDTGADGAMSDLKPGKAVFIRANKAADGALTANNITVEKNGFKPVM